MYRRHDHWQRWPGWHLPLLPELIPELGALFGAALLSATLFPGGSEALLLLAVQHTHAPWLCVGAATAGNLAGSLLTYAMGLAGLRAWHHIPPRFHFSRRHLVRARRWFRHYGGGSLLFAWLPLIGDPLCLVAGMLRYPITLFILFTGLGKLGRYALLASL